MVGFPSGQREQTVNLSAQPSMVRIHLPPPSINEHGKVNIEQFKYCDPLAQLAEHLTFNQGVPRSSRGWITIFLNSNNNDFE